MNTDQINNYPVDEPATIRDILASDCTPSPQLLEEFERRAQLFSFRKDEPIVRQGEMCDHFILNRIGSFRIANIAKGQEDTIAFGGPGDVFTSMHSWYHNDPAVLSLVPMEDAEVWMVSYASMRRMLSKYPELKEWLLNLMTAQLYIFERRYEWFGQKSAEERFQNFLRLRIGRLRHIPQKYLTRFVPLKYIAKYLNISQATLSRLRRKLVKKRLTANTRQPDTYHPNRPMAARMGARPERPYVQPQSLGISPDYHISHVILKRQRENTTSSHPSKTFPKLIINNYNLGINYPSKTFLRLIITNYNLGINYPSKHSLN